MCPLPVPPCLLTACSPQQRDTHCCVQLPHVCRVQHVNLVLVTLAYAITAPQSLQARGGRAAGMWSLICASYTPSALRDCEYHGSLTLPVQQAGAWSAAQAHGHPSLLRGPADDRQLCLPAERQQVLLQQLQYLGNYFRVSLTARHCSRGMGAVEIWLTMPASQRLAAATAACSLQARGPCRLIDTLLTSLPSSSD